MYFVNLLLSALFVLIVTMVAGDKVSESSVFVWITLALELAANAVV